MPAERTTMRQAREVLRLRPLRTKIQPIRMRAISSNMSEVLAARLSAYDSVGCDDAVTDRTPFPYRNL